MDAADLREKVLNPDYEFRGHLIDLVMSAPLPERSYDCFYF